MAGVCGDGSVVSDSVILLTEWRRGSPINLVVSWSVQKTGLIRSSTVQRLQ